ncbi:MAG: hypoxanthine phosphoribosyltransferase [Magnetococcales bacterium]|nr:hypoxanthine phosphoribosyltransferase [Magnetococcales bacterium]
MPYIVKTLISEMDLQERVRTLAEEIAPRLGPDPIVIGLFKGAFIFTADLVRELYRVGVNPAIDFMVLSSYGAGMDSAGTVAVKLDCREKLEGRHILLVDDILDTGNTLLFTIDHLRAKGAAQVLSCVLLDKKERRKMPVKADFVGFPIPNEFVVGYGIDYAEKHRELPYIGAVVQQQAAS